MSPASTAVLEEPPPVSATTEPGSRTATTLVASLLAGWLVLFALIPLRIGEAFGLPAHALALHVPVVLDPILALATVVLIARPVWRRRYGAALAVSAVLCTAATVVTVGTGIELVGGSTEGLQGTIADHAQAGELTRSLMLALTAVVIVLVALDRRVLRLRAGALRGAVTAAGVLAVVLAVGVGFFVIRTGHLGATLKWGGGKAQVLRPGGLAPELDRIA